MGAPLTIPGSDLTLADQHCVALALKMAVMTAQTMPAEEARAYLRRQEFFGPHRSGIVRLDDDAVEAIVTECAPQKG